MLDTSTRIFSSYAAQEREREKRESGTKRYEIQLNCEEAKKNSEVEVIEKNNKTQTIRTEQSHRKETITCKTNVFN